MQAVPIYIYILPYIPIFIILCKYTIWTKHVKYILMGFVEIVLIYNYIIIIHEGKYTPPPVMKSASVTLNF